MNNFFLKKLQVAKSWLNILCNMNQSFAKETQIDKFWLNC